jgi:hypothetical protein
MRMANDQKAAPAGNGFRRGGKTAMGPAVMV